MDSPTRRTAADARTTRATEEPDGVAKTLFAAERSNGGTLRSRRTGARAAKGTLSALTTAPALDIVSASPAVAARAAAEPTSIAARHALDRMLHQVRPGAIGAVGLHAAALADWLRRSGRSADALTTHDTHDSQPALASRPTKRWPVLVASGCIECAPNPTDTLRALKRMLTPDGRLIVIVPNVTHASSRLAMLRGHFPLPPPGASAARHLFTAAEIEGLLEDAGFLVLGVERELDPVEILKEIGADVPEPVLAVLADDTDALTSHFAILAGPQGAGATRQLHRRVRELVNEQHATARTADQLARRIAALETHPRADTIAIPVRGGLDHADVPRELERLARAMADLEDRTRRIHDAYEHTKADAARALTTIERLEGELRAATERLAARDRADTERDDALRQSRETLLASVGEITSLVARVEKSRYRRLIGRVCEIVNGGVPRGAIVAVISRGDQELLAFDRREGWHFPRTEAGVYAGHHPADSKAAIAHLERVRTKGARYLLIPRTSFWWLEHYREFNDHLLRRYRCVLRDDRTCVVFDLERAKRRGKRSAK